jgi:hypothetical protein
MRIKIIGDNNCARATRHLLRLAGFAVTEFLPVDAITSGPHSGYAITIDLAPATHTPDLRLRPPENLAGSGGHAHLRPDSPAHHYASAQEEAPRAHRDASSLASVHFDSVDSALEAAVLRHVTQLAAAPVIVDRPGGIVHSDRELRIIAPNTGDAKADEAAAVAIEFGVLRGLLDLTSPSHAGRNWRRTLVSSRDFGRPSAGVAPKRDSGSASADTSLFGRETAEADSISGEETDKSAEVPPKPRSEGGKKKWWLFGIALLAALRLAAPGRDRADTLERPLRFASVVVPVHAAAEPGRPLLGSPRSGTYRLLAAEPAQGQFATGQGLKITDGTNFLVVDPCKAQTKSYASISQTASTQLVAGTASKKIYVCSIHVVVAAATNVAVVEGTGTVCGTGTAGVGGFGGSTAATGWNFAANSGIALGNGDSSLGAEVASGDNLCIFNSGSGQVSGGISYVVE